MQINYLRNAGRVFSLSLNQVKQQCEDLEYRNE
jgi:hypothetical protein